MTSIPKEFLAAYQDYDRESTIRKTRLGCLLGIILVPLFGGLDFYVFRTDQALTFLRLRLFCAALMAGLYPLLGTGLGRKFYRIQGILLLLLPSATIAWMIHATDEGAASPYYAGLTLVLMVLAVVLDWTYLQSVISVLLVLVLYLCASLPTAAGANLKIFLNNLFFLASSGIAIIAGTYFHSQARVQEFVYQSELDKSRKALEASLVQLKENEAQLVHSEKLASLGRMSAGIIHEINNPLNFVTTALFTLRKKGISLPQEQQQDYSETLKDVEEGVGRVKTIVSDLRVFTRQATEHCDEVLVAEVVAAALRFLNIERNDQVQFEQVLPPDLTVWANKNKLIHILANLLQNSLDALKTKAFTDETPTIRIEGRTENGASILSVRDNGPGIAAAHLNKIYDPFFTTKDVGAGMGLGLSICYRLVEEAQGKIAVNTKPGKFCEFMLAFPARKKKPADD
jgi:two-component system, sensor histidine kinase PhcS